ncbi:MAG: sulfotransferase [Pseudomonadota bacterium]
MAEAAEKTETDGLETARTAAASRLKAGDFVGAETAAAEALAIDARDPEALYLLAVARRYLGRLDDALGAIDRLIEAEPRHARARQERGHILRACGRSAEARNVYSSATALNPALQASWAALAELAPPGSPLARNAAAHIARLKALPPEIAGAESLLHDGKLAKAEGICRAFLKRNPTHVEAMRLLAELGARLHILDDAEFVLESALAFEPENTAARLDYVRVLHRRQRHDKALSEAEKLLSVDQANPVYLSAVASERMAIGDYDEAIGLYDRLCAEFPSLAENRLARGHALKTVGRTAEAVNAYRAAYAIRPDFGDAYWSLANLKTYRFTDDEIGAMRAAESAAATADFDRYHLAYALGKAFEDRGDTDAAFDAYARGASLKRSELRYDADRMQAEFDAQKAFFTPERVDALSDAGAGSTASIFIVGLPRAGSTLIEQILASHSEVEGTLELPHILALAHRLNGRRRLGDDPRYPGVLEGTDAAKRAEYGERYLADTAIYRTGAPRFTDKMPNNFRHIGLIRTILPNARIIDARRDAMACCFSGFKQLFAEGQEFSYSLEDIGRYYRGYVDLMNHWDAVYPGTILRVQHKDVVDNLETSVRRILDFCGLDFEPACLEFHKTERSVRTASSEQVRQPIYRSGLDQWRRFEAHLGPLKTALGPELCAS